MKDESLGPFLGIDNRSPDHRLEQFERGRKAGDWLRNAVNVDLTSAGTLQRREGVESAQAGTDCHSLWSPDEREAYYVDEGTLYKFPREVIKTGLTPGMMVSYTKFGSHIFWSNGAVIERIRLGVSSPVGVSVPNPAPNAHGDTGGALPEGWYLVAFTHRDANGEESGATWPISVLVPENGKIVVSGVTDPVQVFISSTNGDILFRAGEASTTTEYPIIPFQGDQLQGIGLRPMPAGRIVRNHNGRLLVAAGATLLYSEPFAPALYNPARGYIPFPEDITIVEPCGNGVFVVADRTYWLSGADIEQATVVEKLPYGAVFGTGSRNELGTEVWWFSERGMVVGTEQGEVRNVQEERVAVAGAALGAGMFREHNGMRQMVASLFGSEVSRASAGSWMEAEIIRKESML